MSIFRFNSYAYQNCALLATFWKYRLSEQTSKMSIDRIIDVFFSRRLIYASMMEMPFNRFIVIDVYFPDSCPSLVHIQIPLDVGWLLVSDSTPSHWYSAHNSMCQPPFCEWSIDCWYNCVFCGCDVRPQATHFRYLPPAPGWTDGNHRARVDKFWCVNVNVLRALRVIDMVHVNLPNDWRESGLVGFQCAALKIRA